MRHNYVHLFTAILLDCYPGCKDDKSENEKVSNSQSSIQNANQLIQQKMH